MNLALIEDFGLNKLNALAIGANIIAQSVHSA